MHHEKSCFPHTTFKSANNNLTLLFYLKALAQKLPTYFCVLMGKYTHLIFFNLWQGLYEPRITKLN